MNSISYQTLIEFSNSSVDLLVENHSDNPENLVQYFKYLINQPNENKLTNTSLIYKISASIERISSDGKLNENQEKIIQEIINKNNELKIPIYIELKKAKEQNNYEQMNLQFEFLQKKLGIEVAFDSGLLLIEIKKPKISFDILSGIVENLCKIFEDVSIKLIPSVNINLSNLRKFLNVNGESIDLIDLFSVPYLETNIDDDLVKKIISCCPNLESLSLNSDVLTNKAFYGLEYLNHLRICEITSSELTDLRDRLPESIETLILDGNPFLKKLSNQLPNLIELNLSGCENLKEIPLLPETLQSINLSNCNSLDDDKHRLPALSSLLNSNFKQGLKLYKNFYFDCDKKLGKLITETISLKLIKENFLSIKLILPENSFKLITLKLINEDFDFFLENMGGFSLKNLDKEVMEKNPKWELLHKYRLKSANMFKLTPSIENEIIFKDIPEIHLDELLNLYDSINFTSKEKLYFVDPKSLTMDGDKAYVKMGKNGIQLLLSRIENKQEYEGVPDDELERHEWYIRLTHAIKLFISLAKNESDKLLVSNELIRLSMAGHKCGGRWFKESVDCIKALSSNYTLKIEGLSELIAFWMEEYKQGVMEAITMDFASEIGNSLQPHIFNLVASMMKSENIPLSNEMTIDLQDDLIPQELLSDDEIKIQLQTYLNPIKLAKFLKDKINEELLLKPNLGLEVLVPLKEYAANQHQMEIQELENSIELKKIEFGVKNATASLNNNLMIQAILTDNQSAIANFKKTQPLQFRPLLQELSIPETEENNSHKRKRKLIEPIDDQRLAKKQKNESEISKYTALLQNQEEYTEELKALGNNNAYQEIRFAKDNLINEYLEDQKLVTITEEFDSEKGMEVEIVLSLDGTLAILEHLQCIEKNLI